MPKQSGLMRHYSVLSLGDQLVYQAFANVVADKLFSRVRSRYRKNIFGNLYGGPQNRFFYQYWIHGYRAYNREILLSHGAGNTWVAAFDFASFFDSIDARAFSTILQTRFGVAPDLVALMLPILERWTSSDSQSLRLPQIYLGHGIPQGPQPSGLLSEVMLAYIDQEMVKLKRVKYVRYCDDIKILGKHKEDVQYAACVLDRLARTIGLFPQANKYKVEEVEDPYDLIKTISIPSEFDEPDGDLPVEALMLDEKGVNPEAQATTLGNLLRGIVETGDTKHLTLFKFLLGGANPDGSLAEEVVKIIFVRPDLIDNCCRYLEKLPRLPSPIIVRLLRAADSMNGYSYVAGRVLRLIYSHVDSLLPNDLRTVSAWVKKEIRCRKGIQLDCQVSGLLWVLAVRMGLVSTTEVESWLADIKTPWWSIAFFAYEVDPVFYGQAALVGTLTQLVGHPEMEVSRAAAYRLCEMGRSLPNSDYSADAHAVFASYGLAKARVKPSSRMHPMFLDVVPLGDRPLIKGKADWLRILNPDHHDSVLKYLVRLRAYNGPNRNGFICELDSALELVLLDLRVHCGFQTIDKNSRAARACRNRREVLWSRDFAVQFPHLSAFCKAVNQLRNRCDQPHAYNTTQSKKTTNHKVTQRQTDGTLRMLAPALNELAQHFPAL